MNTSDTAARWTSSRGTVCWKQTEPVNRSANRRPWPIIIVIATRPPVENDLEMCPSRYVTLLIYKDTYHPVFSRGFIHLFLGYAGVRIESVSSGRAPRS